MIEIGDHVLVADLDHVRPLSHEGCHAPGVEPWARWLPTGWSCRPPSSGTADFVKRKFPDQRAAEDMCEWFDSVLGHRPFAYAVMTSVLRLTLIEARLTITKGTWSLSVGVAFWQQRAVQLPRAARP